MNRLYLGDCLDTLRAEIKEDSVDLIYIDPPFNSKRDYNIFFDDKTIHTQRVAFEDTWSLKNIQDSLIELQSLKTENLYKLLMTYSDVASFAFPYLVMMALRIIELHRVLKPTGSFYLHCDPTMSHYLKTICDIIFGVNNFRSEIIWRRSSGFKRVTAKKFPQKNDTIFFYAKTENLLFNPQYLPYSPEYLKRFKPDKTGRLCRTDVNPTKGGRRTIYLDETKGNIVDSIWDDIYPINPVAKERLGYPTQKPKSLMERIIKSSSNEQDVVLDAFCGCGTTVDAAEELNRQWIGIDISPVAITLIKRRLENVYGTVLSKFEVRGIPTDNESAIQLWEQNPFAFQDWWIMEFDAFSATFGKKGPDKGIDGISKYLIDKTGNTTKAAFQVKGGKVQSKDIDALLGAMEKHKCELGVFLTINKPTKPMLETIANSGFIKIPGFKLPKLQYQTLAQFFSGKKIKLPPTNITFDPVKLKGKIPSNLNLF